MLDPVLNIIKKLFLMLGRGVRFLFALLLRPFGSVLNWWRERGWIVKSVFGGLFLLLAIFYGYFLYATQVWTNFNPKYVDAYDFAQRKVAAGAPLPPASGQTASTCQSSAIVKVAVDLTDFNVNQNAWVSSMLAYKLGFFGVDWDNTPFMDNKASFQRGINQAVRRTAAELADGLGRVRATSGIDGNLNNARGEFNFGEESWYLTSTLPFIQTSTPARYRRGMEFLNAFNRDLENCRTSFDTRSDNLAQFMDHISKDLGATSQILKDRAENHSAGYFDFRADDRFWFAYGQLYAYYGILKATEADFRDVIEQRKLGTLWRTMDDQFASALRMQPLIVSNGREGGAILPSHLTTMGFNILRVHANLREGYAILSQ